MAVISISYKNVLPDKKFLEEFKLPSEIQGCRLPCWIFQRGFVVEENGYFYEQYDVIEYRLLGMEENCGVASI